MGRTRKGRRQANQHWDCFKGNAGDISERRGVAHMGFAEHVIPSCTGQSKQFSSVQFSPLTDWVVGGHEGRISKDPLPVFSAGGCREQFWHWQECPLFGVFHSAFPLPTTASPTIQGALNADCGEAVVACDMPEPCKLPSLDSCQKL